MSQHPTHHDGCCKTNLWGGHDANSQYKQRGRKPQLATHDEGANDKGAQGDKDKVLEAALDHVARANSA